MAVGSFGGVAGRAGAIRVIALSISPHVCPRQGRRMPAPKIYAAGAGRLNTRQRWRARREAAASDSIS